MDAGLDHGLADHVVAIMGGTSGIGLAIALALASRGVKIVALGKQDAYLLSAREQLAGHTILAGDATVPESAETLTSTAWDTHHRLDGLVHVAGGSGRRLGDAPLHLLTDEGLTGTMALNLHSAAWSNRAALRLWMAKKLPGSIVNISSVLATRPSAEHFSTHAYAAAKAGLNGLSLAAAAHYAASGIRVNVIAPGLTDTPMASRAAADPGIRAFIQQKQPLDGGRMATPDDVTGAALFLLSPASRFCTGQILAIDGGWSVSG